MDPTIDAMLIVCRTRFRRVVLDLMIGSRLSRVACPACGTYNLLPHHPNVRAKGR
jgi:hypothetical protein